MKKMKKTLRVRSTGDTVMPIKTADAVGVAKPVVGRRAMLAAHANNAAPKSAAAKAGLKGRAAFVASHRHAGGSK